jgi:hypothetical protein
MSLFVVFALFVAFVLTASAQGRGAPPQPRRPSGPRMDLSVGAGFLGGSALGDADADVRGSGGQPYQLFATSSRIGRSIPLEVRLDFLLGPRYVLEMRGAWSRPELQTSISGDIEGAPPLTVVELVDQYSLDLGLLVNLTRSRPRAVVPFISAGAGYVAAVHEGLTLLESGIGYRGGGGIKYPLAMRTTGRIKGVGIRADAALIFTTSGLATGSGATHQVATSGSFYLTF